MSRFCIDCGELLLGEQKCLYWKEQFKKERAEAVRIRADKQHAIERADKSERKVGGLELYAKCWEELGEKILLGMQGHPKEPAKDTYNKLEILLGPTKKQKQEQPCNTK